MDLRFIFFIDCNPAKIWIGVPEDQRQSAMVHDFFLIIFSQYLIDFTTANAENIFVAFLFFAGHFVYSMAGRSKQCVLAKRHCSRGYRIGIDKIGRDRDNYANHFYSFIFISRISI